MTRASSASSRGTSPISRAATRTRGCGPSSPKATNIKIVGNQPTDYDPVKALNVATNLLTANPDLNYIYSWRDEGALAALQAAKSKGLAGKIGIAGFGGNCLNLAEVIKGNIHHETTFFPQSMGAQMVQAAAEGNQGPEAARNHAGADPRRDDDVREEPPLRQDEPPAGAGDRREAEAGEVRQVPEVEPP